MKITVNLKRSKEIKNVTLEENSIIIDLLKKLKLKPDTVITMRNKIPVPVDDNLEDNDKLDILQISSSG